VASALSNLGFVLQDRGDLADAEPLQREALAIRSKAFGDENPGVAKSLNFGRPCCRRAPAAQDDGIRSKKLPARHVDIASGLANLALCLIRQGPEHCPRERTSRSNCPGLSPLHFLTGCSCLKQLSRGPADVRRGSHRPF
jgi:hypothetical protein